MASVKVVPHVLPELIRQHKLGPYRRPLTLKRFCNGLLAATPGTSQEWSEPLLVLTSRHKKMSTLYVTAAFRQEPKDRSQVEMEEECVARSRLGVEGTEEQGGAGRATTRSHALSESFFPRRPWLRTAGRRSSSWWCRCCSHLKPLSRPGPSPTPTRK